MSFEEGDISQMDLSYQPESEVEESDADENVPLGKLQVQEKTEIEQVQQVEQVDQTVPVEQALSVEQAAPVESAVSLPQQTPEPVEREAPLPAQPATLPKGSAPVDGFQLVQATGLTDTSTSAPKGSEIPSFATPTPIPSLKATPAPVLEAPPVPQASADNNPLMDGSKSQVFRERSDFMIVEFFSRQVGRLTGGAPAALDRSYR